MGNKKDMDILNSPSSSELSSSDSSSIGDSPREDVPSLISANDVERSSALDIVERKAVGLGSGAG